VCTQREEKRDAKCEEKAGERLRTSEASSSQQASRSKKKEEKSAAAPEKP